MLGVVAGLIGPVTGGIPQGIWVVDRDQASALVELTGGEEAFLRWGGELVAGRVKEEAGRLDLDFEFRGENISLNWTKREGGGFVDGDGDAWLARAAVLDVDAAWTEVEIRVDGGKGMKLEEFRYRYWIETEDGDWDPLLVRMVRHDQSGGSIRLRAPEECVIHLEIEHPDAVRGHGTGSELSRENGDARLTATVETGRRVAGKVVLADGGEPVAGAVVSPLMFTPPSFSPDRERSVVTGPDGRFEIRAVAFSYAVEHPSYLKQELFMDVGGEPGEQLVRLEKGAMIRGTVRGADGNPLAGVGVSDGSGKEAVTGADGSFVLRGLRKWSGDTWWLEFDREGYNDLDLRPKEIAPGGLEVVMVPLPELRGRVLLPDGSPAGDFQLVCGPGACPRSYECVQLDFANGDGSFRFQPEGLPEEGGDYWLGIRAEGAAPWERVVKAGELLDGGFEIDLKEGVELSARVLIPAAAQGPFEVALEAADRPDGDSIVSSEHPVVGLASRTTRLGNHGEVRMPHLGSGSYELRIRGVGATPLRRPVEIGDSDVALGELRMKGTGVISGIVYDLSDPAKPCRFADGEILIDGFGESFSEPYMKFKADERGRFRVAGVPVGTLDVSFSFWASADILDARSQRVRVVEGRETRLRVGGEEPEWAQPLRLRFGGEAGVPAFGGGREVDNVTARGAMLRFDIAPLGSGPATWPESVEWDVDDGAGPVIRNLSAGRWRIRVFDWLGSRGFDDGLRGEIVAAVGDKREPLTVDLGGLALSGRVTSRRDPRRYVRVVAVGRASGRVFPSRCDASGAFVVRYLPADQYTVHAHDDEAGWCDLGSHPIRNQSGDCGEHQLRTGGHVSGRLKGGRPDLRHVDVRAVGEDGVEIEVDEVANDGSFRFGNLRPGPWTIRVSIDERPVEEWTAEVKQGETVQLRETWLEPAESAR